MDLGLAASLPSNDDPTEDLLTSSAPVSEGVAMPEPAEKAEQL